VVECSPPYDHAEQTSLIAGRVVLDCLATQVRTGVLGQRAATLNRRAWGPFPT
jgi:agmatinase